MPSCYSTSAILAATLWFLLLALSHAQTILPATASSTFPACAYNCNALQDAQTLCTPPNSPAANEQSCFCGSSYLVAYYSGSSGPCNAACTTPSDQALLQSWYLNYCASPTSTSSSSYSSTYSEAASTYYPSSSADTTFLTSASSTASIVTPTQSATTTQTSTSDVNSVPSAAASSANKGWFSTHWRWVLMLAILVIGLGLVAILAVYLKRRHRRRLEARRAAASGFDVVPMSKHQDHRTSTASHGQDMWGPHQHMAATKGWEYTHEQDEAMGNGGVVGGLTAPREKKRSKRMKRHGSRKGKERDVVGVREVGGNGENTGRGEMRELNTDYATRSGGRRRSPRRRDTRDTDRGSRYSENNSHPLAHMTDAITPNRDHQRPAEDRSENV